MQGVRAGSGHAGAGLVASCTQLLQKFAPVLQRGHMCDEADDVCKLCVTVTPGSRGFGIAPLLINFTQSGEGHARSRRVARRLAADADEVERQTFERRWFVWHGNFI